MKFRTLLNLLGLIAVHALAMTSAHSQQQAQHAQERQYSLLEREIEYLVALWPGEYDNREQVSFNATDRRQKVTDTVLERVHVQVSRVQLPAFGEYVLYVENYGNGDPENITGQQLYVLLADSKNKAIRLQQHSFRQPKRVRGAHSDATKLAGITAGTTLHDPACDLLIRRDNDWLTGHSYSKSCATGGRSTSPESNVLNLRISADQLWFGGPAADASQASWYQLERVRWFACMIDFPPEPGGRPTVTHHYMKIHDQGGAFSFTDPAGQPLLLTMRNTWSYGMNRESFVIAVQEKDESGPTVVYAWAPPGSDRIGMNPGQLRVQCDLDTPENVKMQHWLRPDS